jgi:hypothetical protein
MASADRRSGRPARNAGTVLIVFGCLAVLVSTTWAYAIAGVFAFVGVGLRVEAAITDLSPRSADDRTRDRTGVPG